MLSFIADPRDGSKGSNACNTCCCLAVQSQPGETNKWRIDYHDWAIPLMGEGLIVGTQFSIETKAAPVDPAAPTNSNYIVATLTNTASTGTVATNAVEPEARPLAFELLPFDGPSHGTVTFDDVTGAYTYTPHGNFIGYDKFFFATESENGRVVREVAIKVGPVDMPPAQLTPPVKVNRPGVAIDYQNLTFALSVSPAVQVGDVFKLTIRQPARDCDCNVYTHTSCYNISVGKC